MSVKTIRAENVQTHTPLAYFGTPEQPLARPVFATAYREGSIVTIASMETGKTEVKGTQQITVDYDPESVSNIKGLRYCHKCETVHLRRVIKSAQAVKCDGERARKQAAQAAGFKDLADKSAKDRIEARDRQFDSVMDRLVKPAKSRDELIAVLLRNVAADMGTRSHRFAVLAATYHLPVADAAKIAEHALVEKGLLDASSLPGWKDSHSASKHRVSA